MKINKPQWILNAMLHTSSNAISNVTETEKGVGFTDTATGKRFEVVNEEGFWVLYEGSKEMQTFTSADELLDFLEIN